MHWLLVVQTFILKYNNNIFTKLVTDMIYIKSKNYYCFLSLLSMIITDTLGNSYFTEDILAEYFGLVLPYDTPTTLNNVSYSNNPRNYGVHINEIRLNKFFTQTGIPLYANYIQSNPYSDDLIDSSSSAAVQSGKYVIYTFSYGGLYHDSELISIGHVALLEEIISEYSLKIYDPGPKDAGIKVIDKITMYDAIRDRNAGIYIFSKTI